jgi:hypothetical protein
MGNQFLIPIMLFQRDDWTIWFFHHDCSLALRAGGWEGSTSSRTACCHYDCEQVKPASA